MHRAINDLASFYQQPLGKQVRRLLTHRIRARWRDVRGMTVMGLGFSMPYLGGFGDAARLGALVPTDRCSAQWPSTGGIRTVLVDDDALPLPDSSVDRLLAIHALEFADNRRLTLREIWRVLSPEGRVLMVLPNRRGFWANRDVTPFGHGEPYSRGQIERLLDDSMFTVEHCAFALAMPPISGIGPANLRLPWGMTLPLQLPWRPGPGLERLGCTLWPELAGVVIIEASKRVIAVLPKAAPSRLAVRLRPVQSRPIRIPRAARNRLPR
jgi:SAM-dependent methyltransferase